MPLPVWRRGERAGLITPRSQDRNLSPVFYNSVVLQKQLVKLTTLNEHTIHRHGAGAARRAHNPEVTRSKRVAGILQFGCFAEATCQAHDIK